MEEKLTERQSNHSTGRKSSHHSHHRSRHSSHRRRRHYLWYHITKPFRRKEKVSGVRVNQQIAEKRIMIIFTLAAVLLLCVLIPLMSWLLEVLFQDSGI